MKNLIYIIAFCQIIVSCVLEQEEEITWQLPEHQNMLVVKGLITNEFKYHEILLTLSNSYFDTSVVKQVSGASVYVENNGSIIYFFEDAEKKGLYISEIPFAGKPRADYILKINTPEAINGINNYTAISHMPEGQVVDSINCEIYSLPDFGFETEEEMDTAILVIYYFGIEPENNENYYFTKTSLKGELINQNPKEYNTISRTNENTGYVFIDSYLKNSFEGDSIDFKLYTIERNYYQYLEALKMMDQTGDAMSMSGPPANAVGNIENGKGLGYFLAAFVSEAKGVARDMR